MRLNHVTIIVSDFERSKAFYAALGLEQIVDAPPRYARFMLPDGDATLSIEVDSAVAASGDRRVQVFIECDDLDERVAVLKARGVHFAQDPVDMPYLWREAHLSEPDGHDVRLYRAGENRLNPPWRMKPADASPG
jgi:catechol 2,3-dioxygenase-like lactoylglutathione lyase family enzyme